MARKKVTEELVRVKRKGDADALALTVPKPEAERLMKDEGFVKFTEDNPWDRQVNLDDLPAPESVDHG